MSKVKILLVEDNEGDIVLTREALEECNIIGKVEIARDGAAAIRFFDEILREEHANLPDMVLLDINLPKKNGHEVLLYIKEHDLLRHIPVIMLTTSSSEKDIVESYKHYANCYITKPVDVDNFIDVISQIETYWFNIVQLPYKKLKDQ